MVLELAILGMYPRSISSIEISVATWFSFLSCSLICGINTIFRRETADGVRVPAAQNGKIAFEMEYRFMLYRHWSLYDAMYFSNFVAARLCIWRPDGKAALNQFLAKMGISLRDCQQKYAFMSSSLKKRLRDKMEEHAAKFSLVRNK